MNKKYIYFGLLALALVGCDRRENRNPEPPRSQYTADEDNYDNRNTYRDGDVYDPTNTGINVRDRDYDTITPFDQNENESDRRITQQIRRAIMNDDSLSALAKNIKIVTKNGEVTLRGPVKSNSEKNAIAQKAKTVAGTRQVYNNLEVPGYGK